MDYIREELVLLIPVIYFLGYAIKKTERIKDKYIPLILTAISVALTVLYLGFVIDTGFTSKVAMEGVVQGFLVVSVAVLGNNYWKQSQKDE